MTEHLRSLRRQRERGRTRVTIITAGSAAGATALAAAFGLVFASDYAAQAKDHATSTPPQPALPEAAAFQQAAPVAAPIDGSPAAETVDPPAAIKKPATQSRKKTALTLPVTAPTDASTDDHSDADDSDADDSTADDSDAQDSEESKKDSASDSDKGSSKRSSHASSGGS